MAPELAPAHVASADRETCYRCFRPALLCLCASIPVVENRTLVSIVQHPRERFHPFGTVRFAALGLRRVEVLIDHLGRLRRDHALLGPLEGAALLYPGPGARDITALPAADRPARLFVLDGTWHHAATLYRDLPALRALPHLTLPAHHASAFAIRKQPSPQCLSTIEAIALALGALEPETAGLERLLSGFDVMQAQQLARVHRGGRHRKSLRPAQSRGMPRCFSERYDDLVVAYAERCWVHAKCVLLSCAAERPATGERFYATIARPGLDDTLLGHLGLSRAELEHGCTPEQFSAAWSRFLGPDAVIAAWHQSSLDTLCDTAQRRRAGVALKSVYHGLERHGGSLEQVVAQEGLQSLLPARATPNRAQARLGNSLRLVEFLRGDIEPLHSQ